MKVIGYLSLGYPTLKRSLTMADDYFEAGCDAIEIGIPSPNPKYEKETIRAWMLIMSSPIMRSISRRSPH